MLYTCICPLVSCWVVSEVIYVCLLVSHWVVSHYIIFTSSHLVSRCVVSHYIYLNISFSQPLGEGFSLYILVYLFQ